MTFDSDKIIYSLQDNWDELVSITFVNKLNYLSISALTYEDEIGIEFNDQAKYVSVLKSDFKFELQPKRLHVVLKSTVVQKQLSQFRIRHKCSG